MFRVSSVLFRSLPDVSVLALVSVIVCVLVPPCSPEVDLITRCRDSVPVSQFDRFLVLLACFLCPPIPASHVCLRLDPHLISPWSVTPTPSGQPTTATADQVTDCVPLVIISQGRPEA